MVKIDGESHRIPGVYIYIIYIYKHTCIPAYLHTCIHASMHPCIHASMHPCMHTMHTHTYVYIRMHTHTYAYIHTHTYACISMHTHTWIEWIDEYMNTWIHECMHASTCTCTCTCTHTHIHTYTRTHTRIHTHTHTLLHMHTHTRIHTHTHTYAHIHTHTHTYTHRHTHRHTLLHIHIHIHITYTYTCMQTYAYIQLSDLKYFYTYMYTCMYTHMTIPTYTNTYIYIYTYRYIYYWIYSGFPKMEGLMLNITHFDSGFGTLILDQQFWRKPGTTHLWRHQTGLSPPGMCGSLEPQTSNEKIFLFSTSWRYFKARERQAGQETGETKQPELLQKWFWLQLPFQKRVINMERQKWTLLLISKFWFRHGHRWVMLGVNSFWHCPTSMPWSHRHHDRCTGFGRVSGRASTLGSGGCYATAPWTATAARHGVPLKKQKPSEFARRAVGQWRHLRGLP